MSSKFLLVVLGMGADPFHNYQTTQLANLNHQPIPVDLDVEDDPVDGQKISAAEALLDVLRCLPLAALDVVPPCIQWTSGIRMRPLELFNKWQAENSHRETGGSCQ